MITGTDRCIRCGTAAPTLNGVCFSCTTNASETEKSYIQGMARIITGVDSAATPSVTKLVGEILRLGRQYQISFDTALLFYGPVKLAANLRLIADTIEKKCVGPAKIRSQV